MEENPFDLKTTHPITVYALVKLKAIRIRDPSESFNTTVDENYKTTGEQDIVDETDWQNRINVRKPFEKHKPQLLKRLEKFSSMWDGNLGTITVKEHRIELSDNAKPSFQQLYRAGPMQRKLEEEIENMLNL